MQRYGRFAILLHWLIGLALIGQVVFGVLLDDIAPRGTPSRGMVVNLHKSIGIVLAVLVFVRLAWRLRHPPPDWPQTMARWQRRAAALNHRLLYACMIVTPASGYVASNFSKHGVKFFGVSLPPWGPDLPRVYEVLNGLHDAAAYLLVALVVAHVLGALKHALVDRDGVFSRMWPAPSRGHGPGR